MQRWTAEAVERAPWFVELQAQVQAECDRLTAGREDQRPALEQELRQLHERIRGWTISLADPELSPAVRKTLEESLAGALAEQAEADTRLRQAQAEQVPARQAVTAADVAGRLNRLADVLAADDPTRANLELALHIEAIRGYDDGRVAVRVCKLGALAGDRSFAEGGAESSEPSGNFHRSAYPGTPRRLARRRLGGDDAESAERQEEAEMACDAHRFAGLAPVWFWAEEFTVPGPPPSWAAANASAVAQKRRESGWTHEQLARHFGKSVPTIRAALKLAVAQDPSLAAVPRKMPRARWQDLHYPEVVALHRSGMSVRELSRRFGKSEPLIRAALRLAEEKGEGRSTD